MSAIPRTKLTPDEYLEFERKSETKHKYFTGEVFAMSGKTAKFQPLTLSGKPTRRSGIIVYKFA